MDSPPLPPVTQALPDSPEAMTTDWLNQALAGAREFADSRIVGFTVEPVGAGRGFTSKIARVQLTLAEPASAPASLVAKFSADTQAREFFRPAYLHESVFYQRFQAETPLRTPRCYHVAYDPERFCFVLLLEDLHHLEGGDQVAGTSDLRVEAAVRNLAHLHAHFWNHPTIREAVPPMEMGVDFADVRVLFREGLDELRRTQGDRYPRFLAAAEAMWQMISTPGYVPQRGQPVRGSYTLLHGDYRLDNMFFGDDSMAVIDWVVNVGKGGFDLGYFLYQSLTSEQLRTHGPALMKLYHQTLRERGVRDYSFRRLRADCEMSLVNVLVMQLLVQVSLLRARDGAPSASAPVEGDGPAALKWRIESFLATLADPDRSLPLFQCMIDRIEAALEVHPNIPRRLRMAGRVLRVQSAWRRVWRANGTSTAAEAP